MDDDTDDLFERAKAVASQDGKLTELTGWAQRRAETLDEAAALAELTKRPVAVINDSMSVSIYPIGTKPSGSARGILTLT